MKKRLNFVLLGTLLVLVSSRALGTTLFVPITSGLPFSYNDIPFEWNRCAWRVLKGEGEFVPTQSIDVSEYTTYRIHIIESASYADNVPDGVTVGHINVHYADCSSDTLDLVMGVNIAEWAYDRPECQPYLQHTKIPPAYSWWTNQNSWDPSDFYWAHNFYVSIDTKPKPLDYLEVVLDPKSYTGQQYYGYGPADCFGIQINAITLEVVPEPATLLLLGFGGLALLRKRRV